jgi:phosphoribosylanthranilate isomerase
MFRRQRLFQLNQTAVPYNKAVYVMCLLCFSVHCSPGCQQQCKQMCAQQLTHHKLYVPAMLSLQGGSGKTFDWSNLQVPTGLASKGWLLAGGLNPSNVAQAVATAHPTAVDVSSGVCGPDGLAKDQSKVTAFISGAKQAATVAH